MKKYGLIGYPLSHSFSAEFFKEKFKRESIDSVYENHPISSIEEFPELIKSIPELEGLNVTIPYKQAVISYLDEMDSEAAAVGAVNVIKINHRDGTVKLKGYNSDLYGFRESIRPYILKIKEITGKDKLKALILGTGGASKAVSYGLKQLGIEAVFVSRNKKNNVYTYEELTPEVIKGHNVIVNTTPLGMSPSVDTCPNINYKNIGIGHLLFDAVYNPEKTLFLKNGEAAGALIKNGLDMLHLQAMKAWEIWNN